MGTTATYTVEIEGSSELTVSITVSGGATAANTARGIGGAIAKINPGLPVLVKRDGRVRDRLVGKERKTVVVNKIIGRRGRVQADEE